MLEVVGPPPSQSFKWMVLLPSFNKSLLSLSSKNKVLVIYTHILPPFSVLKVVGPILTYNSTLPSSSVLEVVGPILTTLLLFLLLSP